MVVASVRDSGTLEGLRREGWPLVYVGRPMRRALPEGLRMLSALGNPYRLPTYTREDAVARYAAWLHVQMTQPRSGAATAVAHLRALYAVGGRLALICWCSPLACQADVLRELLTTPEEGKTASPSGATAGH